MADLYTRAVCRVSGRYQMLMGFTHIVKAISDIIAMVGVSLNMEFLENQN